MGNRKLAVLQTGTVFFVVDFKVISYKFCTI